MLDFSRRRKSSYRKKNCCAQTLCCGLGLARLSGSPRPFDTSPLSYPRARNPTYPLLTMDRICAHYCCSRELLPGGHKLAAQVRTSDWSTFICVYTKAVRGGARDTASTVIVFDSCFCTPSSQHVHLVFFLFVFDFCFGCVCADVRAVP